MKGLPRGPKFRGVSFRGTAARLGVPGLNLGRLRPRMRKRTVAMLLLLTLVGAAIAGWTILRQTAVIRETLEAQLSERFGATVSIDKVEWDGWSTIVAEGLTLRVPDWPSPADKVASIRRAVVVFQPIGLLGGKLNLEDLEIDGLTLRMVERAESPGTFNLLSLKPKVTSGGSVGQPRKAIMRDLRIELGILRGTDLHVVAQRAFSGAFEHVPEDPWLYAFALSQTEEDGHAPVGAPVRIFGTWDERTFAYEATLDTLDIPSGSLSMLPLQARTWARRAQLAGRIDGARISGNASNPIAFAEMRVHDVTLRERDLVRAVNWARMDGAVVTPIGGDVSVHLPSALISLRDSKLEVTANSAQLMPGEPGSGALEIPVELRLSTEVGGGSLRPFNWEATEQWLSDALAAAPFNLRVRMTAVSALPQADGSPRPVELPTVVVDTLREFGATNWMADIDVSVTRARATETVDGTPVPAPVEVKGHLALSEGSITYVAFPYPLHRVKGLIEFEGERVRISDLSGSGQGNSMLRVNGFIDAVSDGPSFDFHVAGTQIPVNDQLMDCFKGDSERLFSNIMDRAAFRSLKDAGLVTDAERPGGVVSCDLRISRSRGPEGSMQTAGSIDIENALMLLRSFPYPLKIKGRLDIQDQGVRLPAAGIQASTPTGAEGIIAGSVEVVRSATGSAVDMHLTFDFHDERFSPMLLAAIPPTFSGRASETPGWPGVTQAPIADLLNALGVQGTLRVSGSVETQPDGRDRVLSTVRIARGTITPSERLPRVLQQFNLSWPAQMDLGDVNGTIELSPEGLDIVQLTASREEGRASARGHFNTDGSNGDFHVDIVGFPLTRDLIGVAQGADLASAYRAWDALQPAGTFNGSVDWRTDALGTSTEARARLITLSLADGHALHPEHGEFTYRDGSVCVHDLELRGTGADAAVNIRAEGTIVGEGPDFTATTEGLTISSPVVQSALKAGNLGGISDTIKEWSIDGGFSSRFNIGQSQEGSTWLLSVAPTWLSGVHDSYPFTLQVQSGSFVATENGVVFDALRAGVLDGWIGLRGAITVDDLGSTIGDLTLSTLLTKWSPDVHSLLPNAARNALEAIEFAASGPVSTDGLRIQFAIPPNAPSTVSVDGVMQISEGQFKTGTPLTHADGSLNFALVTQNGRPGGWIGLDFHRLFVVEREASDVRAKLVFNPTDNTVVMRDLEGNMYDGRVTGHAKAVLGERFDASVTFANVRFAPFAEATDTPEEKMEAWRAREGREGPGRMRGQFHLSGVFGQPELQRGAGRVAVADARMMEFPLGMSILQLSQLMLPLNASLEKADAEFEIMGDVLTFEKFTLASSTLRLEGSGSLSLGNGDLALRFRNRGTLPLVSDLFGAVVGDQMFMIDVGGTLQSPEPHLVPIPILAPEPSLPSASHASRVTSKTNE